MPKEFRPRVGITLDSEEAGGYSKFPWYALRQNYAGAIHNAGGIAFGLAHDPELAGEYLDCVQGLVITGGAFDVDPTLYGENNRHATVTLKERRTSFEWAVTREAFDRNMPILGICGGQQLLNVVFGGTLIQHIPDSVDACLAHEQPNPRDQAGHEVEIRKGSLLHRHAGAAILPVNSAHHQAVAKVADGFEASAWASDGVIEAIEHPDHPFCVGVQWHPEFEISAGDSHLLNAFINACRAYAQNRADSDGVGS